MKKFSLTIAAAMLIGLVVASRSTAVAQDAETAKAEFERTWYDTCYTKKDNEKCYQQSKELADKYPSSQYAENAKKNIKNFELNKAWEKFNSSLKVFYNPPQDGTKLESLFSAGEEFIK